MKPSTTNSRLPLLKKIAWFIALYVGGIVVVGGFVMLARFLLGMSV